MEIITHVLTNPQQYLRDNTEDAVSRRSNARENIGAASQADLEALRNDLSGKIDKVSNANDGHLASLSSDGSLVDSGHSVSDIWHGTPSATGEGNVVTGMTIGNDGVPVIQRSSDVMAVSVPVADGKILGGNANGTVSWRDITKTTFGSFPGWLDETTEQPILNENVAEVVSVYDGTGFGAERAIADRIGNVIDECYCAKADAKLYVRPEVMLYKSSAPTMSGDSSIGLDVSGMTSTTWNDKGADGSVSVDSTGLVGLSVGTLYKCTARFDVHNSGASAAQVTLSASASFAEGVGETSSAVVATGDTTVEMNWYVKGASSVTFSATGLSDGVVTAGISSLFVREVCDI